MKRFYKTVSVREVDDGFEICLDKKPLRVDTGDPLRVPVRGLAEIMVREWAAQDETIEPDTMPVTQIVKTAHDAVPRQRTAMEKTVCAYLDTDLVCYRATHPPDIAERQAQSWDPWLAWFEKKFSSSLKTTDAIKALTQDQSAHDGVREVIENLDDLNFTLLQLATAVSGSLVLALAFVEGEIGPDALYEAIFVEELYKAEIYNETEHGLAPEAERQHKAVKSDLRAVSDILAVLDNR